MTGRSGPFPTRAVLRYRLDELLERGAVGWVIVALGGLMVAFLCLTALVVGLTGVEDDNGTALGYREGFWQALLRALDPGTMASDVRWQLRVGALIVTVIGVLLVSTVIGLVATGIHARLTELRAGRGAVLETGHTLVLGWSPKLHTIVEELALGHLHEQPRVVVLAPRDKTEMDAQLHTWQVGDIKVVTRTGSPQERSDLELVQPDRAHAIIVLREPSPDGDAVVVKTVLALVNDLRIKHDVPIVAEVFSSATARALRRVVDRRAIIVEPGDLVGRVIAQSCRHPGLDQVLCELFSFDGSEIYQIDEPALHGRVFADALTSFDHAIPVGLIRADGSVAVRPPMDTVIAAGDSIVLIAEDLDDIRCLGPSDEETPPTPAHWAARPAERTLVFGFNEFAPTVISELDDYVPAGSELTVVCDPDLTTDPELALPQRLANLTATVHQTRGGIEAVRPLVEDLRPDHVVILSYREGLCPAEADARSLITFLEAGRSLLELECGANVVTEILDSRDIDLVPPEWAHGFIVTERLSSLYLTQLSEQPELLRVFEELLDAEGTEIYFKPAPWYLAPGEHRFTTVIRAAAAQNEIAIGWLRTDHDGRRTVALNPPTRETVDLREADRIIVISDREH